MWNNNMCEGYKCSGIKYWKDKYQAEQGVSERLLGERKQPVWIVEVFDTAKGAPVGDVKLFRDKGFAFNYCWMELDCKVVELADEENPVGFKWTEDYLIATKVNDRYYTMLQPDTLNLIMVRGLEYEAHDGISICSLSLYEAYQRHAMQDLTEDKNV